MKHEWKKSEKDIYLPKSIPALVTVKSAKYFIIDGKGDPNNSDEFQNAIETLYGLSYNIKMMPRNGLIPDGYYEYTVYPLEGIWDMEEAPSDFDKLDKSKFIYRLMIRQPEFVDEDLARLAIERLRQKKNLPLLDKVKFETLEDGLCVQMMHIGSYDDEASSFEKINSFCSENNLIRTTHSHREIYLSDFRRISKDKLRTVLRVMVKHK